MAALDRAAAIPKLLGGGARDPSFRRSSRERPSPPLRRLEAVSASAARLVSAADTNALAQAAYDAFYQHYPLTLSPDAVWFCLAQGFASHVALHAEELRRRFVQHEGQRVLVVDRPDFLLGRPNPWPEAFRAFSDQIASHVGKLRDLVVADFSTTGPTERAASEVLVMDTFQAYFEYVMRFGCGIPSITLLGTVDDWRSVRQRAAMFAEFGLEAWTRALLPVLDELVRTAEGRVDRTFWRSFFRYESTSMGSELTGWMLTLFPYLRTTSEQHPLVPNPFLEGWERTWHNAEKRKDWREGFEGPSLAAIPGSIASAPVKFVDVRDGSAIMLRFVAGLFGVAQDSAGALAPEFGWAVVQEPEPAR